MCPTIEAWGTPEIIFLKVLCVLFIWTLCFWFLRYVNINIASDNDDDKYDDNDDDNFKNIENVEIRTGEALTMHDMLVN